MASSDSKRKTMISMGDLLDVVVISGLGMDLNEYDTHTMSLAIITTLRYNFLLLLSS